MGLKDEIVKMKDELPLTNIQLKLSEYIKIEKIDLSKLTKADIIAAINEFDLDSDMCKGRDAKNWDLIYNGKNILINVLLVAEHIISHKI